MFQVDLQAFRGPLELLLYLVKKHEIDVNDVSVGAIASQFLSYLEQHGPDEASSPASSSGAGATAKAPEQPDKNGGAATFDVSVDDVGDFLDLATTLIETKSRVVLPREEEDEGELLEDPQGQLVQRLLDYKLFKDAASLLEERSQQWQQRLPRLAHDLPPRQLDIAGQPIQDVELWDLVSAYGRLSRQQLGDVSTNVVYDDTPIHVYMQKIHQRIVEAGRVSFSELFAAGVHKSAMVGVFLAILELARYHGVYTEQAGPQAEIYVVPGEQFQPEAEFAGSDFETSAPDSDKE